MDLIKCPPCRWEVVCFPLPYLDMLCFHEPRLVCQDFVELKQVPYLSRQELDSFQPLLVPLIFEKFFFLDCDLHTAMAKTDGVSL